MRQPAIIFVAVALTTIAIDLLWWRLNRRRRLRFATWSAFIASTVWIIAAGVWRNQHAGDFPAQYSQPFNFVMAALPAIPGAITGLAIALAVQVTAPDATGRRTQQPSPDLAPQP